MTTAYYLLLIVSGLLCLVGIAYLGVAAAAVRRFVRIDQPGPMQRPPVTLLKPLCGDEPELYENLHSFCQQAYPGFQVVFGVRHGDDPALEVVSRLRADLPQVDIELVVDGRVHGTNLKISNVINMMAKVKHEMLVLSDSDMRARADYLDAVMRSFMLPSVGLVTCLYSGRPGRRPGGRPAGLWSELGAAFINYGFLPQVLVGRMVGSDDGCFGATMALSRQTLARVGGFEAFKDILADDYALGAAVRGLGLKVELSPHVIETVVSEPDLAALLRHELRWGRTLRSIEPVGYAASIITHPLLQSLLLLAISGFEPVAIVIFTAALASRIVYNGIIDAALGISPSPHWQVPLRDIISVALLVTSFLGTSVTWRERKFHVAPNGQLTPDGDIRS
ncbi:MAG: bacteriohopanetetrol glucosamine biosynthesis glycosyltransferase HpnI [Rhodospirillaceae bacterium]